MTPKKEEQKIDKQEEVNKLLEALQDKYGEGSVMTLGDTKKVDVDVVPTGSFSLDMALGVGGLPKGRLIEIYGPEASGKTTLALNVVAQAQKKGGRAAFIDAEHAMDPEYAERLGVKIKELLISQPDNGEDALNIMESLVRSGVIDVIVIDSVAALTPKVEIEGEMGAQFIGLQARMMGQACRKIAAIAARNNTMIIFINQIREKIGMMGYGDNTTTPGGRALKFYASVRIEIKRIAQIKKGEDVVGNRARAKVVKNKVASPFKIAEFDIIYGRGISYEGDVITTAIKYGVVTRTGNTYSFDKEKLGVGMDAATKKLKEDKKLLESLKSATEKKAEEEEAKEE